MRKLFAFVFGILICLFTVTCKKENPLPNNAIGTPLNDNSIALSDSVIDAEYSRTKNLLLAVSAYPNNLTVINPSQNKNITIALNLEPNCISISPDGNYAIVGHNGWLSYFNLNTNTLVKMQAITCDAFDVVLTNDQWAYVFPENSQWDRIRCVNLLAGIENLSTGGTIYGNTKAKLHPSGNFMYGADNGLNPDDLERYNLSNDTAKYVYNSQSSPYNTHGGDLWMAEDSVRIFTKYRNVFSSTNVQSTDMASVGTLVGSTNIVSVDYSKASNKIYAILSSSNIISWPMAEPDTVVRNYKGDDLSFQTTITLPKLYIPEGKPSPLKKYYSHGYFGFFNATGTFYYAIVKAIDDLGTHKKWAVVTIAVQ